MPKILLKVSTTASNVPVLSPGQTIESKILVELAANNIPFFNVDYLGHTSTSLFGCDGAVGAVQLDVTIVSDPIPLLIPQLKPIIQGAIDDCFPGFCFLDPSFEFDGRRRPGFRPIIPEKFSNRAALIHWLSNNFDGPKDVRVEKKEEFEVRVYESNGSGVAIVEESVSSELKEN